MRWEKFLRIPSFFENLLDFSVTVVTMGLCYICNFKEIAMVGKPKISDAEWQVMRVLWEKSPVTVKEVIEILSAKTTWKAETIRTLINRLTKKAAIGFEKKGRRHYFYPVLSQQECVRADADSFLSRAGAAMLKPILTTFIEKEQLSDEEVEELQRILDKKGGGQ